MTGRCIKQVEVKDYNRRAPNTSYRGCQRPATKSGLCKFHETIAAKRSAQAPGIRRASKAKR